MKMFLFYFNFSNSVFVAIILLVALNFYAKFTKGVCKSKKRLDGKTIIITGANTGIGKETALDLALRGGRVILACRDLNKASLAKDDIVEKTGNHNVLIKKLDLASLDSVRQFAADVLKTEPKLHILINNAGCAVFDKIITKDGLEYQMQTNYFGHFLLTNLLIGLMIDTGEKESEESRVINVSGDVCYLCRNLNLDDLNFAREGCSVIPLWSSFKIYGATKLCNILFSVELSNKLKRHGKLVTVNSLHPGVVRSEFGRFSKVAKVFMTIVASYLKSPKEGAQTTIFLAVADEVAKVTGQYFRDCQMVKPTKLAQDVGIAKKLWEVTETIVKLEPIEKYF